MSRNAKLGLGLAMVAVLGVSTWSYHRIMTMFEIGAMAATSDYSFELVNGYCFWRTSGTAQEIARCEGDSSQAFIPPYVTHLQVVGELVVGKAIELPSSTSGPTVAGYFVLDTRSLVAKYGMVEEDWADMLQNEYGINAADVELLSPKALYHNMSSRAEYEQSRDSRGRERKGGKERGQEPFR